MTIDINYFITELQFANIVSEQKLKPFIDKKSSHQSGESLAKDLIKGGLITKYQAEQILSGKGKSLRVGKYLIKTKLGAGGMGEVYKAQHAGMARTVAIKVIHTKNRLDSQAIQRFDREVKAAARLIHPNVITVFDAGYENGLHYMVMEYCEGIDLAALIRRQGTLSLKDTVDYITQAARGLQYAHEQGVIHRDIKPGNLLIDKNKKIKVVDMGLARLQSFNEEENIPMLTGTTAIMGTVDFMSPEQGLSSRQADARSDIYSLGASLYFLLTGKLMFAGETAFAKLIAHREEPVPPIKLIRADIPDKLEIVYQKMVAKKPEDRYQNMSEVINGLDALKIVPESETVDYSASTKLKKQDFKATLKQADLGLTKINKTIKLPNNKSFKFSFKYFTYFLGSIPLIILVFWILTPKKEDFLDANLSNDTNPNINGAKAEGQKYSSSEKNTKEIAGIDFKKESLFLVSPFTEAKAKEVQNALAKRLGTAVEIRIPLGNDVELEMVLIPPGKFMMGSPDTEAGRNSDERLHEVIISKPFYMGKTEITNEQWESVIQNNSSKTSNPQLPKENMNRSDVIDFITKLNHLNLQEGFSLPTESEWEYTCRAGTTTTFYYGNAISKQLSNFSGNGSTKVKSYLPNAFGLFDMHGNVSEWVSDIYDTYPTDTCMDPKGPPNSPNSQKGGFIHYTVRGGHFKTSEIEVRSASRKSANNKIGFSTTGARVKKSIKTASETFPSKSAQQPTKSQTIPSKVIDFFKEGLFLTSPFTEAKAKEVQNALAKRLGTAVEIKIPLGNDVELEMVLIPPGKFMMGSPTSEPGRNPDEQLHEVLITRPFFISRYETTVEQYNEIIGIQTVKKDTKKHPISDFPLREIPKFLKKLNETNGLLMTFDLPTEAQWEYSCRVGTTTVFSWQQLRKIFL